MAAMIDQSPKRPRLLDSGQPLLDDDLDELVEENGDDGVDYDAGEAAAAEPEDVSPMLLACDYGPNTPTNKGGRKLSLGLKGTWVNIKRIKAQAFREVLGANSAGDLRKVSDVPLPFPHFPNKSHLLRCLISPMFALVR
jgi:hypothetical protein